MMCYCTPNARTPFCNNCHTYITRLQSENVALKGQHEPVATSTPPDLAAKALELLNEWLGIANNCSLESGVCCCGEDMVNHSSPMACGHSPVDGGLYYSESTVSRTKDLLSKNMRLNPTGGSSEFADAHDGRHKNMEEVRK